MARYKTTAFSACVSCGAPAPFHNQGCPTLQPQRGHYQFTPYQLTEGDVRRIFREELERFRAATPAKEPTK